MKIFNCEQGSEEWKQVKLGVLSASRAKEILTKGRGKGVDFGQTAISLVYELIAERMTGESTHIENDATRWGNLYEPEAKRIYQERTGLIVENVGFGLSDESNLVGCSPDGLVGDDGLIEIKCPFYPKNHIKHILEGSPIDYQLQMQFQMFVWKREWNDFVSYDPRMSPPYDLYIKRYKRDPKFDSDRILRLADFMREKMEELLNNCQNKESS